MKAGAGSAGKAGAGSAGSAAPGRGERALALAFVGPTLLFLIALNVFPLVFDVVLSFGDARLTGGEWSWIGGANYARVFSEEPFARALRVTALFVVCAVGIELLLGYLLALGLARDFPGKAAVLTVLLVPMMLSPAVMGLFWNLILNGDYGVLNQLLGGLGLPQPQWTTDDDWKLVSVLLVDVWMWTPFMMLIALAALGAIPRSLYEAAEIDRASRWTVFRRITLPLSLPLMVLAVLLRATDALKQFDLVMAISGPSDGATQTVSALLFEVLFRGRRVGLAAAYGCVVLVVVIALATVFVRTIERLRRA